MKISISFTADLALENIDLPDGQAQEAINTFKKTGTLPPELMDAIVSDGTADLYIEEVLEIDDVYPADEDE